MKFTPTMVLFLMTGWLAACTSAPTPIDSNPSITPPPYTAVPSPADSDASPTPPCPITEPEWVKPPDDAAVQNPPQYGYYFVNEDHSIWASAWWAGALRDESQPREDGFKVGWFRPAGTALEVTGERIDALAEPLEAHFPCCYPTRFQASGLYFPSEGCWRVTARAAGSELTFVVWIEP